MKLQPWQGKAAYDSWRHKRTCSTLTPETVKAIRESDEPTAALAKQFGVTEQNIRVVRKGKIWKWVEGSQKKI